MARAFPFSSAKKRMSTLIQLPTGAGRLYLKGASEIITDLCSIYLAKDGSTQRMDEQMKKEIMSQIDAMASNGLRTIGIAYNDVADIEAAKKAEDMPAPDMVMVFVGLVGIRDPPRKEVPEAVRKCKLAGIKVRNLTGRARWSG